MPCARLCQAFLKIFPVSVIYQKSGRPGSFRKPGPLCRRSCGFSADSPEAESYSGALYSDVIQ